MNKTNILYCLDLIAEGKGNTITSAQAEELNNAGYKLILKAGNVIGFSWIYYEGGIING